MHRAPWTSIAALTGSLVSLGSLLYSFQPPNSPSELRSVRTLVDGGCRLDWGPGDVLAFDRPVNRHFELYVMRIGGSGMHCLTCGRPELPAGHRGNPAWHPSGKYIVFQASQGPRSRRFGDRSGEDAQSHMRRLEFVTRPGAGYENDLWLTDADGQHFWRLTNEPPQGGVLHAHFSPSGDRLFWAERLGPGATQEGLWQLNLADFSVVNGAPRLSNIRSLRPGRAGFYESHGFTPDGRGLIFSGTPTIGPDFAFDIYTSDLSGGNLRNLTQSSDVWDEHGHYSPSGATIMWESTAGFPLPRTRKSANGLRSEYWLMNPDGSGKRQLTHFNTPGSPEYEPRGCAPSDFSWSPDGTRAAGFLQINSAAALGKIVLLQFAHPM